MTKNFANKYKDRMPEETVEIIDNFFKSKNYTVEITEIKEPIPNIWWCHLELKYNNTFIAFSNGKGASKAFALASGYSELYERYCNFSSSIPGCKINQHKLFELNLQKNGYRLFPDEVYIQTEDFDQLPVFKYFCESFNDKNNSFMKYLKLTYPEGILSLPFTGFNVKDTINMPFFLSLLADGSTGMAAGNTLEEALTQGLSEICEHYVHQQIYYENRNFYYLDIDNMILPSYLSNYFHKLKELGYQYHVYDFSYLYQVPVIGLLIVDPKKHISYLDLGSAPNFYIALERCCTEVYQGQKVMGEYPKVNMTPIRSAKQLDKALETTLASMPLSEYYPDGLILNSEKIESYNNKIFLDNNDYSNLDLNNYYKTIFNKKNWEVYYRDMSQSEQIKAVKCYVKNIPIMNIIADAGHNTDKDKKINRWNLIFKWEQLMQEYFDIQNINMDLFFEIQDFAQKYDKTPVTFQDCFMTDFFHMPGITPSSKVNFNFDLFYNGILSKNWQLFFNNNENDFQILRFYLTLLLYSKHYTKEEILKISSFYGIEYSEQDLENSTNLTYLLDKLYFNPYYNYYHSEQYSNIIASFIPVVINK